MEDRTVSLNAVKNLILYDTKRLIPYEYEEDGKKIRGWDTERYINVTKLEQLPSVSQSQKGYWINNDNGTMSCSECHTWFSRDCQSKFMNYCGYCGTRMEGNNDGR